MEIVVVIYNSGKREIYLMSDEEDVLCVIELTEDQAKELGLVLAGLSYQPLPSEKMEIIMKEMVMEWIQIKQGSVFIGKTIAELDVRKKTGASIVALIRRERIVPSPDPNKEVFEEGDTIVAVGTRAHIKNLMNFCKECVV